MPRLSWNGRTAAALAAAVLFLAAALLPQDGSASPGAATRKPPARKASGDNAVVGEVNGEKVLVSQLRQWMKKTDTRHNRAFIGDRKAKDAAYRELLDERLELQYMRSRGAAKSGEYLSRSGAKRTLMLGNLYLDAFRKEYVPPDNEVRTLLLPSLSRLDIRIFFGESFADASAAREEVAGGKDMADLVRKRSVGPGAEKGGLIEEYRSNTYIPEPIEKNAFLSGKGWLSPVFETPLGHAFLRVENSRDLPPGKIEEMTRGAIATLKEDAGRRMVGEVSARKGVTVDEAVAKELDAIPASEWQAHFGKIVARVGGKEYDARDLYWYIVEGNKGVFPRVGSGELAGLARTYGSYVAVAGEAAEKGFEKDPRFLAGMKKFSEGILLDLFLQEIDRSVQVDDAEARDFFRRNRDALKRPEGRLVREVAAPNPETARNLLKQLKENPADIEKFASDAGTGKGKGQVLYKGMMKEKEDEDLVFGAPVGELTGPYQRGGSWVLFIVDREVPKVETPSFDEYAAEARDGARAEKVARAIREKAGDLYRKAAIVTYKEVLESVEW